MKSSPARSRTIIMASLSLLAGQALAQPPGSLLFRSGFESGVWLSVPYVSGNQWWQDLRGADAGFEWPFDLPDSRLGAFQYPS
jgi:hypothetical protein